MKKPAELRAYSTDELAIEIDTLEEELFNLRMTKGIQKRLETPHRFRQLKRSIARVKTIMNERRLGIKPAQKA